MCLFASCEQISGQSFAQLQAEELLPAPDSAWLSLCTLHKTSQPQEGSWGSQMGVTAPHRLGPPRLVVSVLVLT